MQKCFIYVRVSSEDQVGNYSIDQQIKACTEYVSRESTKYEVVGIYKDEGRSATADNRPAFLDMFDECKKGKVNAICVYHTDRFARNEDDHRVYRSILKQNNVKLLSVMQPMLDNSPEGHLMDTFMAGINAYYSRDLGRKTIRGMLGRWNTGWWPSWAPVGYVNIDKESKVSGKKAIGREAYFEELKKQREIHLIEIDPILGPIVKRAFELYATGNYSLLSLTKEMAKKGLKNIRGKRMSVSSLQSVLSNPFYYGLMKWPVGMDDSGEQVYEEKIGKHEPLITYELFQACQYIAAKHRQFLTRQHTHQFLLSGFVYCPTHKCKRKASLLDRRNGSDTYIDDHRRFTAEIKKNLNSSKKDSVTYYRCTNNDGGCPRSYIDAEKLEDMVAYEIKKYEFKQEFVDLIQQKIKENFDQTKQSTRSKIQALINVKSAIEKNQSKLIDAYMDGVIDKDGLKIKQEEYKVELAKANTELADLNSQLNVDTTAIEEVIGLTRNIYRSYMEAPDFIKRHYLRIFFERFYVRDQKIVKIVANPIFEELLKQQVVLIRHNWLLR